MADCHQTHAACSSDFYTAIMINGTNRTAIELRRICLVPSVNGDTRRFTPVLSLFLCHLCEAYSNRLLEGQLQIGFQDVEFLPSRYSFYAI